VKYHRELLDLIKEVVIRRHFNSISIEHELD